MGKSKESSLSKSSASLSSPASLLDKNALWIALFVLVVISRLIYLSADPPIGLTTSQGVYTDPAAYTMYAKSAANFGEYNQLGDTRFPLFQYSAVTPVARVVFATLGVGFAQANFSALLFSLSTILMLCLLMRRHHGPVAVFFMLMFLALNKNQFFYGRLPFLENPMVFFGVLSFWISDSYRTNRYLQILAGVALSASFLLGKSHGLVFVGVFSGLFMWRLVGSTVQERGDEWRRIVFLGIGLLGGILMWIATVGWPHFEAIRLYLTEQSTGLYGPPEAFDSFANFFWKMFSLGIVTYGQPIAASLAFLVISGTVFRLFAGKKVVGANPITDVTFFMTLWVVLAWLELFAWNYRPLRYQIPMVYPICALAGISMSHFLRYIKNRRCDFQPVLPATSTRLRLYYMFLGLLLMFPIYQVWARTSLHYTDDFSFDDSIWLVVASAVIVWVLYIVIDQLWRRNHLFRLPQFILIAALVIAPGISFISGVAWYENWLQRPTFSIVATSHDLPKVLGPGAVISGPYGVGLAQDNSLPALVHQFGVSDPDTTFLDDFPVTHLLLDESNLTGFQDMYPTVANRSFALHTYHITNVKVSLIRIAGATNNAKASSYILSAFEVGQLALDGRIQDPQGRAVAAMMKIDTSNIAVNVYMAHRAERAGALKEAKFFQECAAGASPTDYDIQAEVGRLNLALYNESGLDMFRQRALERFRLAHHLNPGAERITEKLTEVEAIK